VAVEQSLKTLDQMANISFRTLSSSIELLSNYDQEGFDKIQQREDLVDRYEDRLGAYMVRLNAKELARSETSQTAKILHCLSNLERVSDHAVNVSELAQEMNQKQINFSEQARAELRICIYAVQEIMDLTQTALSTGDVSIARKVEPLEEVIDALTEELKMRHIQRVQAGCCTLELGFIFNDCINNFERVADHCSNIALAVLEAADSTVLAHDYLRTVKQDNHEEYRHWLQHFDQKYYQHLP